MVYQQPPKSAFQKGVDKLKKQWEENPVLVIGVMAATMTAASKLIDSLASIQSRRAYAKKMGR